MVSVDPRPAGHPAGAPAEADRDLPRVGVVVLNWNAEWFTRRCLAALAVTDYPADRLRVVLVDNGSVDGSLQRLRAWLARPGSPSVELVENGANLGFAEGCNRGIRHLLAAGGRPAEHVALLNNDAWPEPSWLRSLVAVMQHHERCAAVSARLVLEPDFVGVPVVAGANELQLRAAHRITVSGKPADVTPGVRVEGFHNVGPVEEEGRQVWALDPDQRGRVFVPVGQDDTAVEVTTSAGPSGRSVVRVDAGAGAARVRLLNGLGTSLNEVNEGFDRGYGRPDHHGPPGGPGSEVVEGFCGGAALLRGAALEQVGLFDPGFFAYYEDTDLSWRMRNAGWEVRAAPGAVVHHAYGASGGGGSVLHVFLDRRNWLLSTLRNDDPARRRAVVAEYRRRAQRLFRRNVLGRLRRGRRPRWQPLVTWLAAGLAAAARLPRLRRGRPGARPTARVRSRWQPAGRIPCPVPRMDGPLVVYLDVGETLKAGYRAGIQRVVCSVAAHLGDDPALEVVAVRWEPRLSSFRRLTGGEWESLLRSGHAPEPVEEAAAVAGAKAALRSGLGRVGALDATRRAREQVTGRHRRAVEDSLALELAEGGVLFEVDAVWNELLVDREALLSGLRGRGVHVATFVHDLLPIQHPEWFVPRLRRIFDPVAKAQLRHSEVLVCASEATGRAIGEVCAAEGVQAAPVSVVPLGGGPPTDGDAAAVPPVWPRALPPALELAPYLLVVGTLEPRKNQRLALEVFDGLSAEFPDLHLVLAGRFGWGVDDLADRLRSHNLGGQRLHWLDDVGDAELDVLQRGAAVALVPSLEEGFGLPVVESLARGVPVVVATGGALEEAAAGAAVVVGGHRPEPWVAAVGELLRSPAAMAEARSRAAAFRARTWEQVGSEMAEALLAAFPSRGVADGSRPDAARSW